jgi:hypothetical protein
MMPVAKPPKTLVAYIAGVALLVLWGLLPSEVSTSYSWPGAAIMGVLLAGAWLGSNLCRWLLFLIGLVVASGSILVQTMPLEFVATSWSLLAILVSSLLLTPSMRAHTAGNMGVLRSREPA